jgi:hypothetical protein
MNQNKQRLFDKSSRKLHILAKLPNGEATLFSKTKSNFLIPHHIIIHVNKVVT